MIQCTPQSLCSWNFYLVAESNHASVEFNWLNEQGRILGDGTLLDVRKAGMMSGFWTLEAAGKTIASAQKASPFTRTFAMHDVDGTLSLEAESAFGRSFRLARPGAPVATITPDHPFTRRSSINVLSPKCEFTTLCFAFWLAVLTWRRAASSAAGAS